MSPAYKRVPGYIGMREVDGVPFFQLFLSLFFCIYFLFFWPLSVPPSLENSKNAFRIALTAVSYVLDILAIFANVLGHPLSVCVVETKETKLERADF